MDLKPSSATLPWHMGKALGLAKPHIPWIQNAGGWCLGLGRYYGQYLPPRTVRVNEITTKCLVLCLARRSEMQTVVNIINITQMH